MTNQFFLMILIAGLVGIFFAGTTWVSVDVLEVLHAKWLLRREQKRLKADGEALAADAAGDGKRE